jgi:hypothetical protein
LTTKAAILLTTLGVLNAGIAAVFVGTVILEDSENTPQISEARVESSRNRGSHHAPVTSGCAPCPRCRPVVVPRLPASGAACEITCSSLCGSEIDRYKQMLEDIQHWCNPYCQEQLDECRQVVSTRFYDANGVYRFDEI